MLFVKKKVENEEILYSHWMVCTHVLYFTYMYKTAQKLNILVNELKFMLIILNKTDVTHRN